LAEQNEGQQTEISRFGDVHIEESHFVSGIKNRDVGTAHQAIPTS
jgi:hypothetical protein